MFGDPMLNHVSPKELLNAVIDARLNNLQGVSNKVLIKILTYNHGLSVSRNCKWNTNYAIKAGLYHRPIKSMK